MHHFLLFILSAPAKAVVIIDGATVGSVQGKNIEEAKQQMFGLLMMQSKAITNIQQTQRHMMEALSRGEMPPVKKVDKTTGKRRIKDSEKEDGEDNEENLQPTKEKRGTIQSDGRPSQHMQMYLQPQVQFQSFQPQFQFMQPLCQFQPGYQPQCPPGFQPHFQHHLQHQFPQLQFSQQSYPLQFGQHHSGAWP